MALPLYLAMTAAEMQANSVLPEKLGYMACHFSPYGCGLSNGPTALPEGSMLILNDRIPCRAHDHHLITDQLIEMIELCGCRSVLLDFQRPGYEEAAALAATLAESLPCPVGVSELYAQGLDCPVFLSPVPLDMPLAAYLAPWQGREIWLDAALDGAALTLTETGCTSVPLPYPQMDKGHADASLHCHYTIQTNSDTASFTLFRTWDDLQALLSNAEAHGATRAVGLWQELGELNFQESSHS